MISVLILTLSLALRVFIGPRVAPARPYARMVDEMMTAQRIEWRERELAPVRARAMIATTREMVSVPAVLARLAQTQREWPGMSTIAGWWVTP